MTTLNDDEIIEKSSELGTFFLYLKDLIHSTRFIQSFTARAREPSRPPGLFNM